MPGDCLAPYRRRCLGFVPARDKYMQRVVMRDL